MKKIIVPIDFSEYSENALQTAVHIAKKNNSEVVAVHMLDLPDAIYTQTASFTSEQSVFYMKLAEQKIKSFLDKDYLKDVELSSIIRHYKVFGELNNLAKEENADLIVMGSKGTSGFKEVFVGSNTERVVRSAEVPVLVVKNVPVLSDFNNAIFACDFVGGDDEKPYKEAKALMDKLSCKLQLLHVNTPYANFLSTAEIEKNVSNFLQKVDGNLNQMKDVAYISDYTVEEGIFEYANLSGADLIIMATHGRTGIRHFFEGSVSEDVTNHSTLPVLTIRIS